jgi:DNA invertase Pin-like site-specific DNA recombinase
MMGVFAEFERSILQERIRAGIARARSEGKHMGRHRMSPRSRSVSAPLSTSLGAQRACARIAARFGVAASTVQDLTHPFEGASVPAG